MVLVCRNQPVHAVGWLLVPMNLMHVRVVKTGFLTGMTCSLLESPGDDEELLPHSHSTNAPRAAESIACELGAGWSRVWWNVRANDRSHGVRVWKATLSRSIAGW